MDVVGVAVGVVSPLGEGGAALPACILGGAPRVAVVADAALRDAGFARFAAARANRGSDHRPLLERALSACLTELDVALPDWRSRRVGLALGTSSGAMPAAERAYEALARDLVPARSDARALAYGAPFVDASQQVHVPLAREAHVLGACASSTLACGLAQIWLANGDCDIVLAGGYDEISLFVAAGFVALGAVTASLPRPFREARDGLALGEGAGVVALVRADERPKGRVHLVVSGFGASADALHVTAPDRSGKGLHRAVCLALSSAACTAAEIDAVSLHGTGTSQNDAAEFAGLVSLFGEARASAVAVHAMKGETGHLFGAAGIVESLSLHRALEAGVALPSAGGGSIDPACPVHVIDKAVAHDGELGLKTSLAFGGLNAALVLRKFPREGRRSTSRAVDVLPHEGRALEPLALVDLAARLGVAVDRLSRCDGLTRLVLQAICDLRTALPGGVLPEGGVVVGHDVANVATNALFARRLFLRGPRFAEPRRFPFTTPNACAGESAIFFGLHGPAFAVGGYPGGEFQALDVARDLVGAGQCEAAVVVEVTDRSAAGDVLLSAWGRPERPALARARLVRAVAPRPVVGSAPSE